MTRIILLITLLILTSNTVNAAQIYWYRSLKKAKIASIETGKPILLDFTAKWCEPCVIMDRDFWPREDVVEFMKRFISVKVNFDKSRSLKRKYRINAIPFVIATDPWGRELASQRGFEPTGRLLMRKLNFVPKSFIEIISIELSLRNNDKDIAALRTIGEFYQSRKLYNVSSNYLSRLLKRPVALEEKEDLMLKLVTNYIRIQQYKKAEGWLKKFQTEFAASKNFDQILYLKIMLNVGKKKPKKNVALMTELTTKYPNSRYINPAYEAVNRGQN